MLPNFYGVIEVKHYHCGYLRVQAEVLRYDEEQKQILIENLKQIDGVESIQVNSMLGTALVEFREDIIQASFLYLVILKALGIDEEAFRQKPGKLKLFLKNVGEALDFSIYNKSKGLLDSKMIVAAIFFYYGVKKMKMTPQLPAGATLLWWAYNLVNRGKE